MMIQPVTLLTTTVICLTWSLSLGAEPNDRSELGHAQKLRILVDKVMQPEANWVTEEWMIRETAEADFNVYSPRLGHDRLDEVRRVSAWCQKYGIYHMPWMRGSLSAPKMPAPMANACSGRTASSNRSGAPIPTSSGSGPRGTSSSTQK